MKSKIKQLLYFAIPLAFIFMLLGKNAVAQKNAPALSPALQGYAAGGSNANWITFRESTEINPATIFIDLRDAFGLSGEDNMHLLKIQKDEIGFQHYRYQQYYKNVKVMYGEYIVHQNKDGFVATANGRLITGIQLKTNPSLTENKALETALHFMNAKKYLWQNEAMEKSLKEHEKNAEATFFPKGELVVAPINYDATFLAKDYKLAWAFKIYTDGGEIPAKIVYVDAENGSVIHHTDISMSCSSSSSSASGFNGNVIINTDLFVGSYYSHNNCQATDIFVYNCNRGTAANNYYNDADNAWTDASAVQAQWGAQKTYEYYNSTHSRQSWDGATSDMVTYNNAVYGNPATANNACWGCFGNNTVFGAGNTTDASDDWNTNDIMGHEFTHGVTQSSANLDYNKESGGLNESYSDIFGEMVESWTEPTVDWLVGGDRGAIRSFSNPNTYGQPDTYLGNNWYGTAGCTPTGNNDNCGVHTNSGVQNYWFYLLSQGGSGTTDFGKSFSVTGITRFKARLIAYRALTVYENSSSQYIDARSATLRAAYDLYGGCSAEIIAVGDAWHAVGVEDQSANYNVYSCGIIANGTFVQAISQLNGGYGCTNNIAGGANVTYYAARDRVVLYPGFTASVGSRFIAYLEPCSSSLLKSSNDATPMSDVEKGIKTDATVTAAKISIAEIEKSNVSVFPNPFKSNFALTIEAKEEVRATVNIYNSLGIKVNENSRINLSKGSNRIPFDGAKLSKGIYMVEILMGDVKSVKKIVKM